MDSTGGGHTITTLSEFSAQIELAVKQALRFPAPKLEKIAGPFDSDT